MRARQLTQSRRAHVLRNFKVVCLRETVLDDPISCFEPAAVANYWDEHIAPDPHFNSEVESLYVLLLNVRHRPKGHSLVSQGLLDRILVHPREVFRAAIIAGAAAIVVIHNHPSGDPSPSEADVAATRILLRAAETVGIELLDHVIIGRPSVKQAKHYASLKGMGYIS